MHTHSSDTVIGFAVALTKGELMNEKLALATELVYNFPERTLNHFSLRISSVLSPTCCSCSLGQPLSSPSPHTQSLPPPNTSGGEWEGGRVLGGGEGKRGGVTQGETESNFYLFLLKLPFFFHDATVDSCTCEHSVHIKIVRSVDMNSRAVERTQTTRM